MIQFLFHKENDITRDWLFYIENEARSLSQRNEFAINNYFDREIFNPEMKKFLSSPFIAMMLDKLPDDDYEPMYLNLTEGYETHQIDEFYKPRFLRLKKYGRQLFQETVFDMEDRPATEIIRNVLYAFIPVFPNGFPTVILPMIISFTASMIKYGVKMGYPAANF